jgi:hypothetical protein
VENELAQAMMVGGRTMAHPIGVVALLVCCSLILFSKKHFVVPAILILIFVIPSAQRILILSIDFSFLRIAILVALLRAQLKGDQSQIRHSKPDKLILIWMVWSVIAYGLLNQSFGSVATRAGYMVDAVGAYFVGRIYITSWEDIRRITKFIGYASIPVAAVFLIERSTGRNMFSVFGGINEYTLVRDGKLRCQGPFSHPIMAGQFWAATLPWFIAIWNRKEMSRALLAIMVASIMFIIINTTSSTPVMAVVLCLAGAVFFSYRNALPALRWLAVLVLLMAQIVMEKGAAHLIARVNVFSGSTGWHRYHLIDEAKNHIGEWWLFGTRSTEHWGAGLEDVTNQYILEAVRGGLLGLVLFVAFLFALFKVVGTALRGCGTDSDRWVYWSAGVVLFVHMFSFLSASYFGQMVASFFLYAGGIAGISTFRFSDRETPKTKVNL